MRCWSFLTFSTVLRQIQWYISFRNLFEYIVSLVGSTDSYHDFISPGLRLGFNAITYAKQSWDTVAKLVWSTE